MDITDLARRLQSRIRPAEGDAVWALLSAVVGFAADNLWFLGGIDGFTVALLSSSGGMAVTRIVKSTSWYQQRLLDRIDQLVAAKHLRAREATAMKNRAIGVWFRDKIGREPRPDRSHTLDK